MTVPNFAQNSLKKTNVYPPFPLKMAEIVKAFFGTAPRYLKKQARFPDAEFNAESIDTNFKYQKLKTEKLVCPFSIALFHFETNVIK